jgi:hypothetical protein
MKSTDGFEEGQSITRGEKILIVMLLAGVLGYWAGFKVVAPGDIVGMPVAAAAALFVVAPPHPAQVGAGKAGTEPVEQTLRVSVSTNDEAAADRPVQTF